MQYKWAFVLRQVYLVNNNVFNKMHGSSRKDKEADAPMLPQHLTTAISSSFPTPSPLTTSASATLCASEPPLRRSTTLLHVIRRVIETRRTTLTSH
jgi:hypothetical protein